MAAMMSFHKKTSNRPNVTSLAHCMRYSSMNE